MKRPSPVQRLTARLEKLGVTDCEVHPTEPHWRNRVQAQWEADGMFNGKWVHIVGLETVTDSLRFKEGYLEMRGTNVDFFYKDKG